VQPSTPLGPDQVNVIQRTAAARDVINAWWEAVERNHIVDPNILCLSRDSEAFDIQDEEGNQAWPEEGVEIFLSPLNKTSPEVMQITVTWDGNNNNNTFTWSGPSGVLDCTGQRPVGPAVGGAVKATVVALCH
jgi:hypothetical protein